MEVIVRHFGTNKEKVIRVDRNLQHQNDGLAIYLVDLWVLCAPHFTLDDDLALSVLYNGKFYSNPHDLIPLVMFARVDLLQVPPYIVDKLHVDGTSLSEAISWISEAQNRYGPMYSSISDVTAAISTLSNSHQHQHQNDGIDGLPNAQPQPPEAVDPGAAAPVAANQQNFFQQWIRVGLLARLAIFYFMFYHDRVESPKQQMLIIGKLYSCIRGLFSLDDFVGCFDVRGLVGCLPAPNRHTVKSIFLRTLLLGKSLLLSCDIYGWSFMVVHAS